MILLTIVLRLKTFNTTKNINLCVPICRKVLAGMAKVHIYAPFGFKYNIYNSTSLNIVFWNDAKTTAKVVPKFCRNVEVIIIISFRKIDVEKSIFLIQCLDSYSFKYIANIMCYVFENYSWVCTITILFG